MIQIAQVLRERGRGLGIVVSKVPKNSHASYSLQEPAEASCTVSISQKKSLYFNEGNFFSGGLTSPIVAGDEFLASTGRMEASFRQRTSESLGINPQENPPNRRTEGFISFVENYQHPPCISFFSYYNHVQKLSNPLYIEFDVDSYFVDFLFQ